MVTNAIDPGGYYPNNAPGTAPPGSDVYATSPGTPAAPSSTGSTTGTSGGMTNFGLYGSAPSDIIGTGFYAQEGGAIDTGDDAPSAPDTTPSQMDADAVNAVRGAFGYASQNADDDITTGGIGEAAARPLDTVGGQLAQPPDDSSTVSAGKKEANPWTAPAGSEGDWENSSIWSPIGNALASGYQSLKDAAGRSYDVLTRPGPRQGGYAAGGSVEPKGKRNMAPVLDQIERVMAYGRRKHGILQPTQQQPQQPQGAIPMGGGPQNVPGLQGGGDPTDPQAAGAIPDDQSNYFADPLSGYMPPPAQQQPDQPATPPAYDQTIPRDTVIGEQAAQPVTRPFSDLDPFGGLPGSNKVMDYLRHTDAAHPEERKAAEAAVGSDVSPDHKAPMTVAAAAQTSIPYAWTLTQAYRGAFENSKHFAAAAADNGDMSSAANAANLAFQKVPDGNSYNFKPTENGVTMSVTDADGHTASTDLTQQQLSRLLKSPQTMFDALAGKGGPALSQPGAQYQEVQDPQTAALIAAGRLDPNSVEGVHGMPSRTTGGRPWVTSEITAQQQGLPAGKPFDTTAEAKRLGVDKSIADEARQLFPTVGQNQKRLAYIDQRRQQNETNKIAETKLADMLTQAQIKSGDTRYVADQKRASALETRQAMGQAALNVAAAKGQDAMRRELVQVIARNDLLSKTNAGRAATAMLTAGKPLDDINDVLKQAGTSVLDVWGHDAATRAGMANYYRALGVQQPGAPAPQLGAAPQTVSTQIPGAQQPQWKRDQDGKWWMQGPNDTRIPVSGYGQTE